jgi:predicted ATP-grasp superfamily ATP-dependent carboligase
VRLPAVVKPSRSVPLGTARPRKVAAAHVGTHAELIDVLHETPAESFPLLVQQRVTGAGIGVFFLVWDGRVVARFAHRRLREKPPTGGVSVLSESVVAPAELDAAALRLLEPASWRGVAMVEFKVDDATGTPFLMEINARVWGSLQLAIDAGVDFPRLLVDCALGHPPAEPVVGRAGHRLRWWFGDLDHLIIRVKRERGVRPRLAAFATFLFGGRGARNEVFRADDWRPALRETIDWIRGR